MELALELREAVISAVCAKNVDLLPGLIQKLAKLSPTEDVLRGSGVGHLVGDRHIWGLAGYTTRRRAAALEGQVLLRDLTEDTGLEGAQLAWQVPPRWHSSGSSMLH